MKNTTVLTILLAVVTACTTSPTPPTPGLGTTNQATAIGDGQYATLAAGSNNDWSATFCNDTYSICQLIGNSSGSTITGIDPQYFSAGDVVWLRNVGAYPITIANASSSSNATARLALPEGADIVLAPDRTLPVYLARDWDTGGHPLEGWYALEGNGAHRITTTSIPSRTIGTSFRPSLTRLTFVAYSIKTDSTLALTSGQTGYVEFRVGASSSPTTVCGRSGGGAAGTLSLGLGQTGTVESQLSCLVNPGEYAELVSSGTSTFTITSQIERAL